VEIAQSAACRNVCTIALALSLGLVVQSIRSPSDRLFSNLGGNGVFSNLCCKKKGETPVVELVRVLSISSRIGASVA
jgi:hypothetical protein